MVYPSKIGGDDARMNRIYNLLAPLYDLNEKIVGRLFTGVDMVKGRKEIVSHLELKSGMKVLEISPGPGVFQPHLREQVGAEGEIVALDLSMAMLKQK